MSAKSAMSRSANASSLTTVPGSTVPESGFPYTTIRQARKSMVLPLPSLATTARSGPSRPFRHSTLFSRILSWSGSPV